MATSKDVAKLAGVSHTTVSRAFNGGFKMKPETYERIMKAAKELNYSPNLLAAGLRSQNANTAGIIINSANVAFFMNIVQELEQQLQKQGYRLLISFDGHDPKRQFSAFKTMASAQVDTIMFIPLDYDEQQENNQLINWMQSSGIQFVQLFGDSIEDCSSVMIDDVGGTLSGMRYLMKHGHERILMIGGYNRVDGFERAYKEIKKEPPIPHLPLLDEDIGVCRENIKKAIAETKPTAVFSISDQINVITYSVLSELKFKVPEDISFLAFDDSFWSQSLNISVIGQPINEIAGHIAQHVVNYKRSGSKPALPAVSRTTFMPHLIERNTVNARM